jgi:Zn finger protein HypA/HybF involved in hydrogenase expression
MTTWYEFVCLDCGHSGLTQQPKQAACPRCGSMHIEIQEHGLAPLPDEEEAGPEIED